MFLVLNVPDRSGIRFHAGNYAGDSELGYKTDFLGCIGLALGFIYNQQLKQYMAISSRVAMRRFEDKLKGKSFKLLISGGV